MTKLSDKLKKYAKAHMVDSTAIMTIASPVYAGLEKIVLHMPHEVSINARWLGTAMTFGGFGYLFAKGRDFYRQRMGITEDTAESVQKWHDRAYTIAYNAVLTPGFYYLSGSRDLQEIAFGTLLIGGVSFVSGSPLGKAIDYYRDFTGIHDSKRVPLSIRKLPRRAKLGLAALLTATSVGVTWGVYKLTPEYAVKPVVPQEQVSAAQ